MTKHIIVDRDQWGFVGIDEADIPKARAANWAGWPLEHLQSLKDQGCIPAAEFDVVKLTAKSKKELMSGV